MPDLRRARRNTRLHLPGTGRRSARPRRLLRSPQPARTRRQHLRRRTPHAPRTSPRPLPLPRNPPTKLNTIFDVSQSALLNRLANLLSEPPPQSIASPSIPDPNSVGTLASPSSPEDALSSIVWAGAVDDVVGGPLRSPSSPSDLSSPDDALSSIVR